LEAINNQLTASASDQDFHRDVLKAKNVGIALFVASSFDLKSEVMRDEQMHGVCSMFEQISSDFWAILRDLDVYLRESVGIWDAKKQTNLLIQ
jgi:hypothetical protein